MKLWGELKGQHCCVFVSLFLVVSFFFIFFFFACVYVFALLLVSSLLFVLDTMPWECWDSAVKKEQDKLKNIRPI